MVGGGVQEWKEGAAPSIPLAVVEPCTPGGGEAEWGLHTGNAN